MRHWRKLWRLTTVSRLSAQVSKRLVAHSAASYVEPVMGLFKLLKGALGIPHYAGIEDWKKAALSGDSRAQFTLGGFYERGQLGLPQDYTESGKWYRKAAEQDHHAAQLYLGVYLAQGQGVEQNVVEGLKWILLAKRGGALDRNAANETQTRLQTLMTDQQIAEARVMAAIFAAERGDTKAAQWLNTLRR
jgi:TPR repeat protein